MKKGLSTSLIIKPNKKSLVSSSRGVIPENNTLTYIESIGLLLSNEEKYRIVEVENYLMKCIIYHNIQEVDQILTYLDQLKAIISAPKEVFERVSDYSPSDNKLQLYLEFIRDLKLDCNDTTKYELIANDLYTLIDFEKPGFYFFDILAEIKRIIEYWGSCTVSI